MSKYIRARLAQTKSYVQSTCPKRFRQGAGWFRLAGPFRANILPAGEILPRIVLKCLEEIAHARSINRGR